MKKQYGFAILLCLFAAVLLLAGCGDKYRWDEERKNYNITGEAVENGTLWVTSRGEKVTRAAEGDVLYVNLAPETGYERESVTVNGEPLTGSRFRMPAGDVTIAATVRPIICSITVDPSLTGGTITVDKTSAMYGETVTLTVTPENGYIMPERTLTVNDAEIYRGIATARTEVTFRMPPHDVVISARFKAATLDISSVADWNRFADRVNGGEDMSGWVIYVKQDIGSADNPVKKIVGNESARAFSGIIEGGGHTVWVDLTGKKATGLIGYANGATVRDLTVAGKVTLTAKDFYAGGFIGMVQWAGGSVTTLENCVNRAAVESAAVSNAGGFVGRMLGNLVVSGCTNAGAVTTVGNYAAGVVGYIHKSSVTGAGNPSLTVRDTVNTGSITAVKGVGGIVGLFHSGASGGVHVLENVSNTGTITGETQVGSLIGVVTSQAADGFDLTITYREAAGAEAPIGSDGNQRETVIRQLTDDANA